MSYLFILLLFLLSIPFTSPLHLLLYGQLSLRVTVCAVLPRMGFAIPPFREGLGARGGQGRGGRGVIATPSSPGLGNFAVHYQSFPSPPLGLHQALSGGRQGARSAQRTCGFLQPDREPGLRAPGHRLHSWVNIWAAAQAELGGEKCTCRGCKWVLK
ncbi:hypothetical protein FKM82_017286 [Ascaphus truei]